MKEISAALSCIDGLLSNIRIKKIGSISRYTQALSYHHGPRTRYQEFAYRYQRNGLFTLVTNILCVSVVTVGPLMAMRQLSTPSCSSNTTQCAPPKLISPGNQVSPNIVSTWSFWLAVVYGVAGSAGTMYVLSKLALSIYTRPDFSFRPAIDLLRDISQEFETLRQDIYQPAELDELDLIAARIESLRFSPRDSHAAEIRLRQTQILADITAARRPTLTE